MAQKTLIYIVDDEPMQRELLKDNLEKCRLMKYMLSTGEECLAASQVRISLSFSSTTI
ncbi:MAG: hypothetical protein IPP46_17005 [Bacteroidetes bacterium]|nr:hypothetical protein [Bacteroidota bacterium]